VTTFLLAMVLWNRTSVFFKIVVELFDQVRDRGRVAIFTASHITALVFPALRHKTPFLLLLLSYYSPLRRRPNFAAGPRPRVADNGVAESRARKFANQHTYA
jgi:hypothetical protein